MRSGFTGSPELLSLLRTSRVALVLQSKEFDYRGGVLTALQPAAHPSGVGEYVMWLRATCGDHFIVKFPGQWQVGKAVAVHMAHFLAPISVFCAAKSVW